LEQTVLKGQEIHPSTCLMFALGNWQ